MARMLVASILSGLLSACSGLPEWALEIHALWTLGRRMRMVTIPNQSSVPRACQEFDARGRMKASSYYDRVVDIMEELYKFTLQVRDRSDYLTDRYDERKKAAPQVVSTLATTAMSNE